MSEPADASAPAGSPTAERPANLRCSSCGAPIFWACLPSGKRAPFDADPVEAEAPVGCYAMLWRDGGEPPWAIHRPALWRSHFATCPNAAQHRKTRAA